jgi:hypothetical protein
MTKQLGLLIAAICVTTNMEFLTYVESALAAGVGEQELLCRCRCCRCGRARSRTVRPFLKTCVVQAAT